MNKNFLHIGYHKTGTTWMQKFMFPFIFKSNYFGKSTEQTRNQTMYLREIENLKNLFCQNSDGCFSDEFFMKPQPKEKFDFGQNAPITNKNTLPTPSKEFYVCSDNHIQSVCRKLSSQLIDEKINTKIILSIRNQTDLFFSMYLHQKRSGGAHWNNPDIWVRDLNDFISNFDKISLTKKLENYYNFEKTYSVLKKGFGQKNIHVIIYENIFNNVEDEVERLYSFLGADIDVLALDRIRKYRNTKLNESRNDSYKRQENGQNIRRFLQDKYKDSNEKLSREINFDLKKYGYWQ